MKNYTENTMAEIFIRFDDNRFLMNNIEIKLLTKNLVVTGKIRIFIC